jgi:hypothetical protein
MFPQPPPHQGSQRTYARGFDPNPIAHHASIFVRDVLDNDMDTTRNSIVAPRPNVVGREDALLAENALSSSQLRIDFATNHSQTESSTQSITSGAAQESSPLSTTQLPSTSYPSIRLQPKSTRDLVRACGVISGTPAIGNKVSGFTAEDLVAAVKSGQGCLFCDSPLSEAYESAAEKEGYSVDTLNFIGLSASQQQMLSSRYPLELDNGIFLDVVVPQNYGHVPFKRTRGGGNWLPPSALVHLGAKHDKVMQHFDVNGSWSPIYSQSAPSQVDIRMLGSLPVTAYELIVVGTRVGTCRSMTVTDHCL